jgi:hypothetical protein
MSILIPLLNSCVCSGDFLLANKSPDAETPNVCRIQRILYPDQLIVIWWLSRAELSSRGILQLPPPLPIESYTNMLKCQFTEVHEISSAISTVSVNAVKDIAFVFHPDVLEYDLPNCGGMSRVFYTRYRYDNENRLVQVDRRRHSPFSNITSESFPSRIWNSILDIKEKVEKCLNDPKQYQLCKKTCIFKLSLESWNYIFMSLVNSGAVVVYLHRNHTKKYMQCDLTMCSRKTKQYLTLVRLDSVPSLTSARSLFGRTFGIGVRNRAPNKGEPFVSLHAADAVNLVDVRENSYEDRLKEFVLDQGIDFFYEPFRQTLKIRLRYCKLDAQMPIVASTLQLNRSLAPRNTVHPEQPAENLSLWVHHVRPGVYFVRDEQLLEVVRVHGDSVVVQDDNNIEEVINKNEAAELLRAYIG